MAVPYKNITAPLAKALLALVPWKALQHLKRNSNLSYKNFHFLSTGISTGSLTQILDLRMMSIMLYHCTKLGLKLEKGMSKL